MEVSHVVQLTEALLEAEEVIEESTAARHHYLNVQKEHEDNLEQQGGSKRRATGSTRRHTPAPQAPVPIHTLSHEGSPELPRRVVDKVLGNLQHSPDSWPLIRFDLTLHKSASYYAIWRRFLHLNEYLRTFTAETADATIDEHAGGLTEHLVQFLAGIIMALEPARVITKVRAPDFLFLHEKDFWFKQIWVDLHQTMVLDRQGSYIRPIIGLARCVCKDEHDKKGRSSPIKLRVCNLHFFAPIWMAQPIAQNFRRMSMADLEPRQPGYFDYKEGWYEWDGQGKHEEECFAGQTMGCIQLIISDNNVEQFHYQGWGPIEYFAAQGVIKDSIWNARIGSLGLKARVDIPCCQRPVAGRTPP